MQSAGEQYWRRARSTFATWLPLFLLSITISNGAGAVAARPRPEPDPKPESSEYSEYSRQGVELMMNGDLDGAIGEFRRVQRADPQSPLGYLLESEAVWWRIYYSTAKLLDPDVFDVATTDVSPEDSHFSDLVRVAITRSQVRIAAGQEVARHTLYEGMAYALEARLSGLRGKDLATARAGKKMRALLLTALNLDHSLSDAYLGLGIYNYFIDTLPEPIKLFRVLGSLPAGNRGLGLQQIQQASQKGDYLRGEATFYLAKNYSRNNEHKYTQSLELFQGLNRDFPRNPLWVLLAASMEVRLGHARQGDALYRQAFEMTRGKDSQPEHAVHRAAGAVLLQQHPHEKFDD